MPVATRNSKNASVRGRVGRNLGQRIPRLYEKGNTFDQELAKVLLAFMDAEARLAAAKTMTRRAANRVPVGKLPRVHRSGNTFRQEFERALTARRSTLPP